MSKSSTVPLTHDSSDNNNNNNMETSLEDQQKNLFNYLAQLNEELAVQGEPSTLCEAPPPRGEGRDDRPPPVPVIQPRSIPSQEIPPTFTARTARPIDMDALIGARSRPHTWRCASLMAISTGSSTSYWRCMSGKDPDFTTTQIILVPLSADQDQRFRSELFQHPLLTASTMSITPLQQQHSPQQQQAMKIQLPTTHTSIVSPPSSWALGDHDQAPLPFLLDFCRTLHTLGNQLVCAARCLPKSKTPWPDFLFFQETLVSNNNSSVHQSSNSDNSLPSGAAAPPQPAAELEMALVSFPDETTVRLYQFPEGDAGSIYKSVEAFLILKDGSMLTRESTVDINLKSARWSRSSTLSTERARDRVLIVGMLQQLLSKGWNYCVPVRGRTHIQDILFMRSNSTRAALTENSSISSRTASPSLCCITLEDKNAISVFGIQLGTSVEMALTQALENGWGRATSGPLSSHEGRMMTWICHGDPWQPHTHVEDVMKARKLVCYLLESMINLDWRFYCAMTMSFRPNESSSLVFVRRLKSAGRHASCSVGCLHLHGTNELLFIKMPVHLLDDMERLFNSQQWPWRLKSSSRRTDNGNLVAKLRGHPWASPVQPKAQHDLSNMMIAILNQIGRVGHGKILCTAYLADGEAGLPMGCDSFFFTFPQQPPLE